MDELYQLIEDKIKASGYTGEVNGFEIYNEICDFIDEKENGTYIFLSKKTDTLLFEYNIDVMEDTFNLSYLTITDGESSHHIDFDA